MKKRLNTVGFIIYDIGVIILSYYLAYWIRFEGNIEIKFFMPFLRNWYIIAIIKIFVFRYFKLYKSIWRYASIDEMMQIVGAIVVSNITVLSYIIIIGEYLPRSVYIITTFLDLAFIGGFRFLFRTTHRYKIEENVIERKKIMIVGAGSAGSMIIKELREHKELGVPIVVIDDNRSKIGLQINGVPVLGNREDITYLVEQKKINEIIIAIPSANRHEMKSIIEECKKTNCKLRTLPGIYEIIDGKIDIKSIRDVDIEDLLGRDVIKLNIENICDYLQGRTVLVTGGGGSIGSELCRQIIKYYPKKLIIFDIYENNVYSLEREIIRELEAMRDRDLGTKEVKELEIQRYRDLGIQLIVNIGSVRDRDRLDEIFKEYMPDVVFHAAAHKHVPLMEDNPKEAVKNNIFGTYNISYYASKYNTKKFVLISTDKAVNPTNIMGATKRVCEMIIQAFDKNSDTEFAAVRFGNVLGSNGSVIPLFKKQIEEGGPVTVTHKEVIRYFMTIPEAVGLVIEAGAMAKGGEIFVLDMGEPVKILDLAKDLIKLSGLEPEIDIPINIVGLRPGEKLFEELLLSEEGINKTDNDKIFIAKPTLFDKQDIEIMLDRFKDALKGSNDDIIRVLKENVITYN